VQLHHELANPDWLMLVACVAGEVALCQNTTSEGTNNETACSESNKKTLLPYAISKQCYEQTMLIQSNCKALLASGIARKHF
jgi:hypothetical protein